MLYAPIATHTQMRLCVTMSQHLRESWLTALVHLETTTKG